jgi:hypothetical protein
MSGVNSSLATGAFFSSTLATAPLLSVIVTDAIGCVESEIDFHISVAAGVAEGVGAAAPRDFNVSVWVDHVGNQIRFPIDH